MNKTLDTLSNTALANTVMELMQNRRYKEAIEACQLLNKKYSDYDQGWNIAYQLAKAINHPTMALTAIETAISLNPENPQWVINKAICLAESGQLIEAKSLALQAAKRKLITAFQHSSMGFVFSCIGLHQEALNHYQQATALDKTNAGDFYNTASVQRFLGDFDYLEQGSTLRRQHMQYNIQGDLDTLPAICKAYDSTLFNQSIKGCNDQQAIFILGMPRTGTTLLERILASHSAVYR